MPGKFELKEAREGEAKRLKQRGVKEKSKKSISTTKG
jgi:hypothetical protein